MAAHGEKIHWVTHQNSFAKIFLTNKFHQVKKQAVVSSHRLETSQQFLQIILAAIFGGQTDSERIWNVGNNL